MAAVIEKMEFLCALLNEFLPGSPVIELLIKSKLEDREKVRIFSSKNDKIGFEKYLKRTIRSLKILLNFGHKKVRMFSISKSKRHWGI